METAGSSQRSVALAVLLIIFTVTLAHYFNFRDMGLYEDDYGSITARHVHEPLTVKRVAQRIKLSVTKWPWGRPGLFMTELLATAGYKAGGRHGMRFAAYLIVTANALMIFFIFRRAAWHTFAVYGALAFTLFPAVTVHSYMTNVLLAQFALLFALVALYLYLHGRRIASYLAVIAGLSLYESVAFLLLAAPLLQGSFDRRKARELLANGVIVASLIGVNFTFKMLLKDPRLTGADPFYLKGSYFSYIPKIFKSLFIGPAISLSAFATRIPYVVQHWSFQLSVVFLVSAVVYYIFFARALQPHVVKDDDSAYRNRIRQLFIAGLALGALGYVVTSFLHYPPSQITGRNSRIHVAAMPGVAMLFTCLLASFHNLFSRLKLARTATFLLVVYFSLLLSFRYLVQLDYVKAWDNQRYFWSQVNELCPDLEENTVVFVARKGLPDTSFIQSYSWSVPLVQRHIFKYPRPWLKRRSYPRVFVVREDWAGRTRVKDGRIQWHVPPAAWVPYWEELPEGNLIILENKGRRSGFRRLTGDIVIQGTPFSLKPLPDAAPRSKWKKGPFHDFFL